MSLSKTLPLGRAGIERLLPFGSDWVFIEEVLELRDHERIVTRQQFSQNNRVIAGHYTNGGVVVPGVILIECIGQSALLLHKLSRPADGDSATHYLARCKAKFTSVVRLNDDIIFEVDVIHSTNGVGFYQGIGSVGRKKVCNVNIIGSRLKADINAGVER